MRSSNHFAVLIKVGYEYSAEGESWENTKSDAKTMRLNCFPSAGLVASSLETEVQFGNESLYKI